MSKGPWNFVAGSGVLWLRRTAVAPTGSERFRALLPFRAEKIDDAENAKAFLIAGMLLKGSDPSGDLRRTSGELSVRRV